MSESSDEAERTGQHASVSAEGPIPKAVAGRLSLYLRELQHLVAVGRATISSRDLADVLNLTGAQVRKDLAHFGHFGHPGIGYRCQDLIVAIRKILGTDRAWPVVLVGAGNLGRALLGYKGFRQQGFQIVAALDLDHKLAGTHVENVPIHHVDRLDQVIDQHGVRMAMVAVPAAAAQLVADKLVESGVVGIVNFAPVTLSLPDGISLVGVDLAIELEQITFSVVNSVANE